MVVSRLLFENLASDQPLLDLTRFMLGGRLERADRQPVVVVVEGTGKFRALQRVSLGAFSKGLKYHILETASAKDALSLLEIVDADIVVTAERLRDMPATGFTRLIRQERRSRLLPVIVLGARSGEDGEADALAAGADEYLRLPMMAATLEARIITQLRRKWAADEREDVESILFTLAQTVEQRDATTGGHCQRLADLSVRMGRRMGLSQLELEALYRGGFLHDIGKIAVPDSILFKPGPLSEAEWKVMRTHTTTGEEICRPMRTLASVLPVIRSHHERWDGSGYPDGLVGEEIPLLARILQIVDIYDALTTVRPYKTALAHREAIEVLRKEARQGWRDPELVNLFAELFPKLSVSRTRAALAS
jgi:putative two-component system response regulator